MENKPEYLKGESLMLKYKIRESEITDLKPGLILLLHGIGSNEDDLFILAENFPPNYIIVSARAPYSLSPGRYAWFGLTFLDGKPVINAEEAEKSRLVLNIFISQLIDRYNIDPSRAFLGGFSQGGIMSYSVGLTYPKKLNGIFILSSRLLPEVKPVIKPGSELQQLNIFIAHGKADQVLPLAYAHEAHAYLQTLTDRITYKEYDMAHTTGAQELEDLKEWLLNNN